jgi:dienelactone hydrolase
MLARILKGFRVLLIAGTLCVGLLFAALWVDHARETILPAPTGPFAVGRVIDDWRDDGADDPVAPVPGTKRELLVWIWYPATAQRHDAGGGSYLPDGLRTEVERNLGVLLGKFLTRDLSKVHSHSFRDAEMAAGQSPWPVVVIRGGASSAVWNYSTLAEDLASHGYVVVGFDAPYRTQVVVLPDGRVMKRADRNNPELCEELPPAQQDGCVVPVLSAWTADTGFALQRLEQMNTSTGKFEGRLDMTRVGVYGHSLGGATALEFCHEDSRCKAGIDLDGRPFGSVVQAGLRQPFLFVFSDQVHSSDAVSTRILGEVQSIYDRLPADGRERVAIKGASHFLFSDDGALLKSHVVMGTLRMLGLIGIDGERQLEVTAYCVRGFFDRWLKGTGAGLVVSGEYPEIERE